MKKIILAYASAVPAADAARSMKVSYVTVRTIYALIRKRLIAVGLYQTRAAYESFKEDGNEFWDRREYDAYMRERLSARRGASSHGGTEEHAAELLHWFLKPRSWSDERFAYRHYLDILEIVRLGGPLNKEMTAEGLLACLAYHAMRSTDVFLGNIAAELKKMQAVNKARLRPVRNYKTVRPRYGR